MSSEDSQPGQPPQPEQQPLQLEQQQEQQQQQQQQPAFKLVTVVLHLPDGTTSTFAVDPFQTTLDLSNALADTPTTCIYTNFELHFQGAKLPDLVPLGNVEGWTDQVDVTVVQVPYTETTARIHVGRVRNMLEGGALYMPDAVSDLTSPTVIPGASIDAIPTVDKEGKIAPVAPIEKSLASLYPANFPATLPRVVEQIQFSNYNPPQQSRLLKGDLFYLTIEIKRGESIHVTASTLGFFINKSSYVRFDPAPAAKACGSSTLVGLLIQAEPEFEQRWKNQLQELALIVHPMVVAPTPQPSYPWAIKPLQHPPSVARSLLWEFKQVDSLEAPGQMRDWNEEYQLCRSLPKSTMDERLLRDHELVRIYSEFGQVALEGAVQVVKGLIPALNPNEPKASHLFLYRNIFFCYSLDSRDAFPQHGGDNAAHYAAGKDFAVVSTIDTIDIPSIATCLVTVIDYLGWRLTAQSMIPGILRHGAAPQPPFDLGDEAKKDDDFVIVDKKDAEPQQDSSIVYGSIDNGKTLAVNDEFLPIVKYISQLLYLESHIVKDDFGKEVDLPSSLDWKGVKGGDDRKYLIDLYRASPLDVNFLTNLHPNSEDATIPEGFGAGLSQTDDEGTKHEFGDYVHRIPLLRLELMSLYTQNKQSEHIQKKLEELKQKNPEGSKTPEEALAELSPEELRLKLKFNPDLFAFERTTPKDAATSAEGQAIKDAASFLRNILIPATIKEFVRQPTLIPMDSATFTSVLHARGINMRYLGHFVNTVSKEHGKSGSTTDASLDLLSAIAVSEMIIRGAKHVWRKTISNLGLLDLAPFTAHFFNCFLSATEVTAPFTAVVPAPSAEPTASKQQAQAQSQKNKKGKAAAKPSGPQAPKEATPVPKSIPAMIKAPGSAAAEWTVLSSKSLWEAIKNEVATRFRFNLDVEQWAPWASGSLDGRQVSVLRAVCRKTGVQISAKEYQYSQATTFVADDILGFVPVYKISTPQATDGSRMFEYAVDQRDKIQDEKDLADLRDCLSDAVALQQQVLSPFHADSLVALTQLATVQSLMGDLDDAIINQQKATVIAERVFGLDHIEAATAYYTLASYYSKRGNVHAALTAMERVWLIYSILYGPNDHPDMLKSHASSANYHMQARNFDAARSHFEIVIQVFRAFNGDGSLSLVPHYRSLTLIAYEVDDLKTCVQEERKVFKILNAHFGENDERVQKSAEMLSAFTAAAVKKEKTKQLGDFVKRMASPSGTPGVHPPDHPIHSGGKRKKTVLASSDAAAAPASTPQPRRK